MTNARSEGALRLRARITSLAPALLLLGPALGCGSIEASLPGACDHPASAVALEDTSHPTTVVGDGTAASCDEASLRAAVQKAGVVTFNCGPDLVTIPLTRELTRFNDAGPNKNGDLVIDGGGKVTLDGQGMTRILRQDGCDESLHWITDHCQDYEHPRLVVQRLRFVNGHAPAGAAGDELSGGGGAIYARSGILKVVDCKFENNRIVEVGPDVAGGAIYALQQHGPVYVVRSTFEGNSGSNGGALGSIGVSYQVIESVMRGNSAIGRGMNPASNGTPGGGNGGAIYNDGNTYVLDICRSTITGNSANELGGAVFYVSNDLSGQLQIDGSTIQSNTGRDVQDLPGFFVLAKSRSIANSTIGP